MSLPATGALAVPAFDVAAIRARFPLLATEVHGRPLVYLDNAATTQKPDSVIEALTHYYEHQNANVHRGVHALADRATAAFESARARIAAFLNSPSTEQVIFTRGTTESINLVAQAWARRVLQSGDEILVSGLAHHSNIVPWQMAAEACGAQLRPIPVLPDATLDMDAFRGMLGARTRLVALEHVSNAMGTIHPLAEIVQLARAAGARVLVDGAQSVAHLPVDVQALDVDFYAFSGHKMYGPTGIGVLWGRRELLESMPPWQGGGEMIETVRFEGSTYAGLPYRFEAGTPHIAGAIGLGAAVDFLQAIDRQALAAHEDALLARALEHAARTPGFRLLGAAPRKIGVLSFLLEGAHPHDVGTLLDRQGIAVRTGHHCAQPAMTAFGIPGTVRASFALYNTLDEVDRLFVALEKVRSFL